MPAMELDWPLPQVNRDIRLFLVDTEQMFRAMEDDDEDRNYPDAPVSGWFINAHRGAQRFSNGPIMKAASASPRSGKTFTAPKR